MPAPQKLQHDLLVAAVIVIDGELADAGGGDLLLRPRQALRRGLVVLRGEGELDGLDGVVRVLLVDDLPGARVGGIPGQDGFRPVLPQLADDVHIIHGELLPLQRTGVGVVGVEHLRDELHLARVAHVPGDEALVLVAAKGRVFNGAFADDGGGEELVPRRTLDAQALLLTGVVAVILADGFAVPGEGGVNLFAQGLATFAEHLVAEDEQIRAGIRHGLLHQAERAGDQQIVRIGEVNIRAGGLGEAAVAGGAGALVLLMDGADACVAGGQTVADLAAAVGGAVVDEDDLEGCALLLQDGLHALLKAVAHVVHGHDDADHIRHRVRSFRPERRAGSCAGTPGSTGTHRCAWRSPPRPR